MTINVRAAEGVTLAYVRKNEKLYGLPRPGIVEFGDSVGAVVTLDNPVQFTYRKSADATSVIAEISVGVGVHAIVWHSNIHRHRGHCISGEKTIQLTEDDVGHSSFFSVSETVADD